MSISPTITIQSANMLLPVPVVTTTIGPAWAADINACLALIDSHQHTTGQGVKITPLGININSDLVFNSVNNATLLRTTRFVSQSATLVLPTDIGCLYVVGNELYYNDYTGGHKVQMTSGGNVNSGPGSITGMTGSAGVSFTAGAPDLGTFFFVGTTAVPASLDVGGLVFRYSGSAPTAVGNYILLQAPNTLATAITLILPVPPSSGTYALTLNNAGEMVPVTYNAIAQGMTSVGADAIAATMDQTGTASIANTMSAASAQVIASTMAATGANTIAANRTRATGSPIQGLGGICTSTAANNYSNPSTSYENITNLSVTLTTSGRPVYLALLPDSTGLAFVGFGSLQFFNFTSSLPISSFILNSSFAPSFPYMACIYVTGAGTYQFTAQGKAVSPFNFQCTGYRLCAWEL